MTEEHKKIICLNTMSTTEMQALQKLVLIWGKGNLEKDSSNTIVSRLLFVQLESG